MGKVETITILGSGTMGIDLGVLAALHGFKVILWHQKDSEIALGRLAGRLEKYVSREILTLVEAQTAKAHIRATNLLAEISKSDLVLETIVEDLSEKILLLKQVGQVTSKRCIVATNTSSLSIEQLADHLGAPENFAGLHFFNPALKMELVEVVVGSKTSTNTVSILKDVVTRLEKTAVEVKDSPGFIVNRLMSCQINHAVKMVEQGVATKEDIDSAVHLGLLHPMGPLALADLIGLDVMLDILKELFLKTGDITFEPAAMLQSLVLNGHLGRKTGSGFYNYKR